MEILNHLDLHNYLVKNAVATYIMKVAGDSMSEIGIFSGDYIVVDKSMEYRHRSIVVAAINGEFTMKRLIRNGKIWELWPENKKYKVIKLDVYDEMTVWGTVVGSFRKLIQ